MKQTQCISNQALKWCSRGRHGWIAWICLFLLAPLVQAKSPSTDTSGCLFRFSSSGTTYFSSPNDRTSGRFTSDLDMMVDRFAFNSGAIAGNPEVVVGLYPDMNGVPGNTAMTTGTLSPGAGPARPLYGMFASSATLTNGGVYHLVFSVSNGSATDKLGLRYVTFSDFSCNQRTGRADPMLNRLASSNSGTTWSAPLDQESGSIHAFSVSNGEGEAIGQPYTTGLNTPGVGSTTLRGQRFVYDVGEGHAVTSLMVRVSKGAGNAADDLRVYVLDQAQSIVSSNILLSAGFTNTVPTNYRLALASPLALEPSESYTLALESKGSSASSYVLSLPLCTLTNAFGATFQGTNGTSVYGTSLTALNIANSSDTTAYDMTFALYTAFFTPLVC